MEGTGATWKEDADEMKIRCEMRDEIEMQRMDGA